MVFFWQQTAQEQAAERLTHHRTRSPPPPPLALGWKKATTPCASATLLNITAWGTLRAQRQALYPQGLHTRFRPHLPLRRQHLAQPCAQAESRKEHQAAQPKHSPKRSVLRHTDACGMRAGDRIGNRIQTAMPAPGRRQGYTEAVQRPALPGSATLRVTVSQSPVQLSVLARSPRLSSASPS